MRLIDADAFISEINERIDAAIKWGVNAIADRDEEIKIRAEQAVATFCEASLTAKKMPTIEERKTGKWYKSKEFSKRSYRRICTVCQDVCYFCGEGNYRYCPNCGARMEGESES